MNRVVIFLFALLSAVQAGIHTDGLSLAPITILVSRGDQAAEGVRVQLTGVGEDRQTELDPEKLHHRITSQLGKPSLTSSSGSATLWASFPKASSPTSLTTRQLRGQLIIGPESQPLFKAPLSTLIPAEQANNPAILLSIDLDKPEQQTAAANAAAIPDLSKAFPGEKIFSQSKLQGIETYSYLTNASFAELKKQFQAYLGAEWKEVTIDTEVAKQADEIVADSGFNMEGNTLFENAKHPGVQIGLTQMPMELEGKKYLANITLLRLGEDE